ncbi:MAG: hypothetical protein ILP07_06860 [Treponema sp.]|nr:hypothetical protein [Treponema sp.]MBQ2080986.1 hypothetical protein [Treponema sp.]MEE3314018.1 hypothetical protein [Treponema sp.]
MKTTKKVLAIAAAASLGLCAWAQEKLSDSLTKIYDVNQRMADVKEEYETAFQEANAKLNAEVQKEFARISQLEQEGWESADEYNSRISGEIEAVTTKRYADIERVNNEIRANYDSKLTLLEAEKQNLINDLLDKEIVYSGDSVELSFSSFDRSEKYFPFTVKSKEDDLNYVSKGLKIYLEKAKVAEQWPVYNEYINTNALTAEIHFVVTKKPSSEQYQKKVTVVKLVKKADGLVLGTYNVNEMVEGISMDEAIAANPSAKPVAKPAPSAAPKYDEAPAEEADDTESDEEDVDAPVIESE